MQIYGQSKAGRKYPPNKPYEGRSKKKAETRRCSRCKKVLPISEFKKLKNGEYTLGCISCLEIGYRIKSRSNSTQSS